jgi:hypothetical protein
MKLKGAGSNSNLSLKKQPEKLDVLNNDTNPAKCIPEMWRKTLFMSLSGWQEAISACSA